MRWLVAPAVKHVKHVPEDGENHQVRGQAVQIAQKNAVGDYKLQILHVAVRVRRCRMVIKHQQNAGDKENDEQQKGDGS